MWDIIFEFFERWSIYIGTEVSRILTTKDLLLIFACFIGNLIIVIIVYYILHTINLRF